MVRRQLADTDNAFCRLSPSHQSELVPLEALDKIESLAKDALERKLSVRALRKIVAQDLEKDAAKPERRRRGRPPTPLVLRTLARSIKLFTLERGGRSFTRAQIKEIDKDRVEEALVRARILLMILNTLVEQLTTRCQPPRDRVPRSPGPFEVDAPNVHS